MAIITTDDTAPPRLDPSAAAARQLASMPPEIIERILSFASLPAIVSANATARLFRGAPGGRSPVEHALRARARARGHAGALSTELPAGARTWTEELFIRDYVYELAWAHAMPVAIGGRIHPFSSFSAFVDAEGGLHTCGEELVWDEDGRADVRPARALGVTGADMAREPTRVASLSAVRVCSVAAGRAHLLALSEAGTVYGCGGNDLGQLGLGHQADDALAFLPLPALDAELVVGIAAGCHHSLALTAAGCAYSWGYNHRGQLGHGDTEDRWEPTRIEALDGVRVGGVAAASIHSLLLSAQGAVFSCGYGYFGELGHGYHRNQHTPRRIEALAGVRAVHVSAGCAHSLVVDAVGRVHSFGSGQFGQFGHGTDVSELVPRPIAALAGVRAVRACAGAHSSAVLGADGSAHTFGDNRWGQLRQTGAAPWELMLPVRMHELASATSVLDCALSENHALYVTADGAVHACGLRSAALGLGASTATVTEIESTWPPMRIEHLPPL